MFYRHIINYSLVTVGTSSEQTVDFRVGFWPYLVICTLIKKDSTCGSGDAEHWCLCSL
uniref:Uncharacterized protein n=1 Tax=Anguilla anguilla TaxID=7936 RepID=A0A0E9VM20_ANGAN